MYNNNNNKKYCFKNRAYMPNIVQQKKKGVINLSI